MLIEIRIWSILWNIAVCFWSYHLVQKTQFCIYCWIFPYIRFHNSLHDQYCYEVSFVLHLYSAINSKWKINSISKRENIRFLWKRVLCIYFHRDSLYDNRWIITCWLCICMSYNISKLTYQTLSAWDNGPTCTVWWLLSWLRMP